MTNSRKIKVSEIKIGDYITFKAATRWSSANAKQRRKVVAISPDGCPDVRFGGWSNFRVRLHEIVLVEAGENL